MPTYGHRRTALLIDVTTFGRTGDSFSERPLTQLKPLPFGTKVDELASAFGRVGYQVSRMTNPTADQMEAAIRRAVSSHGAGDVVAVHIMSHGFPGKAVHSLHLCGSDSAPDGPSVDMTDLLRDFIVQQNGPHILFSLDLCHAGKAIDLDHSMRVGEPDKVWFVGATTSDKAAFDARFTTALRNTLERIRTGVLKGPPGLPYVPFTDFASAVREELDRIVAETPPHIPQTSKATLIDGSQNVRDLPFFDNNNPVPPDPPPVTDLPAELAYFAAAANVRFTDGHDRTDFTGRAAEMGTLRTWLRGGASPGPRLVAGRAGSGKSALLGALVCAAHPALAPRVNSITRRVGAVQGIEMMAAVPARHRDVAGIVAMISAQLFRTGTIHSPQGLAKALLQHREGDQESPPAVIVVDSLDEAAAPAQVFNELLRPLSETPDALGNPVCEVVIASRNTSQITAIIRDAATGVIDLDVTDPEQLRTDVENYAWNLLSGAAGYTDRPEVRGALAGTVASRLVTAGSRPVWGEFLVTRLYLHHLLDSREPVADICEAKALGDAVPLDLAEVLELGLAARTGEVWARPVLAALALVHGLGAPANVIARLAGACRKQPHARPRPEELAEVLRSLGSYLRVFPATDGEERYQLFHEGLADHLRDHPVSPGEKKPVTAQEVCDAMFGGMRSWKNADPYVLRHGLYHARGTVRLEELLRDPDFLLCGRPEARLAVAEIAEDRALGELRSAARAALAVMTEHERAPGDRERLAVTAARAGDTGLAGAISAGAYRPALVLELPHPPPAQTSPILLSGANSSSVVQIYSPGSGYSEVFQVRHPHPVVSLCASTYHGDELITGDDRGTARVWPLTEGSIPRLTRSGHLGPVRAIATIERDGAPPVFMSADDQTVRLWNSEDGDWVRTIRSEAHRVTGLVPFGIAGRGHTRVLVQSASRSYVLNLVTQQWDELPGPAGVTVLCPDPDGASALSFDKQGVVSSIDLARIEQERWLPTADNRVTAAVHVPDPREPAVVSGDTRGRLVLWHLRTRSCSDLGGVNGEVTALTSFMVNGRPVVVCASADGRVSVWDPGKRRRGNAFTVPNHIRAFAHDWSPASGKHRAAPLVRCGWGFGGVVIAMVDTDNTVQVHCSTGTTGTLGPFSRAIAGVSVVPLGDQATVAVEDDRGLVRVWHPITGMKLTETAAGTVHNALPLEPNMLMVHDRLVRVEGGDNGEVRLVPLARDGREVTEFAAHPCPLTALTAWQHNGSTRAATCGTDGLLRVWDVESHDCLYEMELPSAATNIVAVHGDHLIVQTDDEIIVLSQKESA